MMSESVSVAILTLNAEREIGSLLDRLLTQTKLPDEIIVLDSSSSDGTATIVGRYPNVKLYNIARNDFDHGGTRNLALEMTSGSLLLFLTQDAIPADDEYIEKLIAPFDERCVAAAYARQVPRNNARRYVQLVQMYNYPPRSCFKTKEDIERLGIKAYYLSDSCSAYRRSALRKIGGIPHPCATNEDMLAACRLLHIGFKISYQSEAKVYHSHNFTPFEQYRRNKAIGRFLTLNKGELDVPTEVGEGKRLVKFVVSNLLKEGEFAEAVYFGIDCIARLFGNMVGKSGTR